MELVRSWLVDWWMSRDTWKEMAYIRRHAARHAHGCSVGAGTRALGCQQGAGVSRAHTPTDCWISSPTHPPSASHRDREAIAGPAPQPRSARRGVACGSGQAQAPLHQARTSSLCFRSNDQNPAAERACGGARTGRPGRQTRRDPIQRERDLAGVLRTGGGGSFRFTRRSNTFSRAESVGVN